MADTRRDSKAVHLTPSQLGTKEYWDQTYNVEIENHASDPSDTGTVWFSDSAAPERILAYILSRELPPETSFLDLGTGNGEMLFLLQEEGGFNGTMLGVDYSASSIELAKRIAETKGLTKGLAFEVWDVLEDTEEPSAFDVVLDKGTFDAVSLSGQGGVEERYVRKVGSLVREGGLVLITSCNWTEKELRSWFEGGSLEYHGRIDYPVFRFGGQTGQSISSICLRKRQ